MSILYLNANQLSGVIPDLSALTNLRRLYLSDNQFSGQIPDMSALTYLRELNLNDNELSGRVPALDALTHLTNVDLSVNQLNGRIPALSTLTSLTTLDLSDNRLDGQIPALSTLTSLESLDLSANQLSGQVPALSALTSLTSLDLTGNQLCLPEGTSLSHSNSAVNAYLQSLNLPSCESIADRAALVSLYSATDGANWTNNSNWLSAEPLSTWHGITTNDNERVTALRLPNNDPDRVDPGFERPHPAGEAVPQ